MFKMRTAILGSAAALAIALPAGAQNYGYTNNYDSYGYGQSGYQTNYRDCETQRRSRQQTAGIVGAIAGGVLGAAIADNDDDDNRYRHRGYRGYDRYDRYGRYNRHNRYYRGHHRDNDSGDQIAGAVIGAVVGGVAGSALAGSGDDCNRQVYGNQPNPRYGNANVPPPTRQAYGYDRYDNRYDDGYDRYDNATTYNRTYSDDTLYGGNENTTYRTSTRTYTTTSPSYGATTSGYNAGYTSGYDSGECRIVYQGNVERTACNVGGDRWEFVN